MKIDKQNMRERINFIQGKINQIHHELDEREHPDGGYIGEKLEKMKDEIEFIISQLEILAETEAIKDAGD